MAENDGAPVPANDPGAPSTLPEGNSNSPAEEMQVLRDYSPGYLPPEDDERRLALLTAAAGYAQLGWQVLPLHHIRGDGNCSCGKNGCAAGKHPVHERWHSHASADPNTVAYWWRRPPEGSALEEWFPRANIGVLTGERSGIVVIDIDPGNGGEGSLAAIEAEHGPFPLTRRHETGSGGTHFFFRYPARFPVGLSRGKLLGPGIDILGDKGMVVVPPSRSAKGWYSDLNPGMFNEIAELPGWLAIMLREHFQRDQGAALAAEETGIVPPYARKYAEAMLSTEAERLAKTAVGRNNQLYLSARNIGEKAGELGVNEELAWAILKEGAAACGLLNDDGEHQCYRTFRSGWQAGAADPKPIEWHTLGASEWIRRPWTEIGNAYRLLDHYGDFLRWCPELNVWMKFESGIWTRQFKATGLWHAMHMFATALQTTEAELYPDEEPLDDDGNVQTGKNGKPLMSERERFLEWVAKQQTYSKTSSAASLGQGLRAMQIRAAFFDRDPFMLNCLNGVINLCTGELLEHDPDYYMMMQAPAVYDPEAPSPQWDAFLSEVHPDPEMREHLQRIMGYTLTGITEAQAFFLHHGDGANGKSVFHSVIGRILGSYGQTVPTDTLLLVRTEGRVPNDVARMAGRRYLAASESRAGRRLDEAAIKQLTGGETVAARFMRNEYFEFQPTGKIHLTSNHLVHLSEDKATWRRLKLIPWMVQIPEERRDQKLATRLAAEEASGILRWLVEGAVKWAADRDLRTPELAERAKEAYRISEDHMEEWQLKRIIWLDSPRAEVGIGSTAAEVFGDYELWCIDQGIKPMQKRTFSRRLQKMGAVYNDTDHSRRGYLNITLRPAYPA
jgi:putative DNA primase/helicase